MTAVRARSAPKQPKAAAKRSKAPRITPRDGEVRLAVAAKNLGLTHQGVGQWAARAGAPVRKEGNAVFVQWPQFARWREEELIAEATKKLREQLDQQHAHPDGTSIERIQRANARKAEIEVEELERTRIRVDDASAVTAKLLTDLRSQLMPFPRRWAPTLITAKTVVEMEQKLDTAISKTMEVLAFGEELLDVIQPEQEQPA